MLRLPYLAARYLPRRLRDTVGERLRLIWADGGCTGMLLEWALRLPKCHPCCSTLWVPSIHSELLVLGIKLTASTVWQIRTDAGIEVVLSGVRMPRMNSIVERWIQTCRHEPLDRTLI